MCTPAAGRQERYMNRGAGRHRTAEGREQAGEWGEEKQACAGEECQMSGPGRQAGGVTWLDLAGFDGMSWAVRKPRPCRTSRAFSTETK